MEEHLCFDMGCKRAVAGMAHQIIGRAEPVHRENRIVGMVAVASTDFASILMVVPNFDNTIIAAAIATNLGHRDQQLAVEHMGLHQLAITRLVHTSHLLVIARSLGVAIGRIVIIKLRHRIEVIVIVAKLHNCHLLDLRMDQNTI